MDWINAGEEMAYEYMKALRDERSEINVLVSEIERRIEALIEIRNATRSYRPKGSINYKINFKVNAVKLTLKEEQIILAYLKYKYIGKVRGDYFVIKKCLFTNKYRVKSYETDWY